MKCYKKEIKERLDQDAKYRGSLFKRGFLITDHQGLNTDEYPFYGLWSKHQVGTVAAYVQQEENIYAFCADGYSIAFIGHAWDPYKECIDESEIIKDLLNLYKANEDSFLDMVDSLTGIFVIIIAHDGLIEVLQDCSGPMSVYFGKINGHVVMASAPQLAGDVFDLERDPDIERLVDTKGYKRGSGFLPGSKSPYRELKRLGCNTKLRFDGNDFSISRIFPREKRIEVVSDSEKEAIIDRIYRLMAKNVELALKKWSRMSLSLSGGMDSRTEFACASDHLDDIFVFSYATKPSEKTDADAAAEICRQINVPHHFLNIPQSPDEIEDYNFLDMIIEHNTSYMCKIHPNEKRKFMWFEKQDLFTAEFKGDVSEIARAYADRKYCKTKLPRVLSPRHFTIVQGRYFFEPWAMHYTDKAFREFMTETGLVDDIMGYSMHDLFYWEVKTGSWAATVYNMQSYMHQIVMIYNNRNLMKLFLRFSQAERRCDIPHKRVIERANPKLAQVELQVKDAYFGLKRMMAETVYYYYATGLNTKGKK